VGTICTHCADGCKTTLGVQGNKILRGNNGTARGINGEFLCIKGAVCGGFHRASRTAAGAAGAHGAGASAGVVDGGACAW